MIIELNGVRPKIAPDVYIAPTAAVIGDVEIGAGSSVWFGAVIRGDSGKIRIGRGTSVQDNVVIHVNGRHDTIIGDDITIGHGAILEGCTVGRGSLIGMNATVLDGVTLGELVVVAAGTVVRENGAVPDQMLVAGVPGKIKGKLSDEMLARIGTAPNHYREAGQLYLQHSEIIEEAHE